MWASPADVHALSVLNKPDEYEVEQEHFPCVKARRVKHIHRCQPSCDPNVIQTTWFSEVYYSSPETPPMTPRKRWVQYRRLEVTPTQLVKKKKKMMLIASNGKNVLCLKYKTISVVYNN